MKILVTGATGFLGSATVKRLLSEGHEVVGIGLDKGFLDKKTLEHDGFSLVCIDLIKESAIEYLENTDGIVHLAARQPSSQKKDFAEFQKSNVDVTYKLLQDAKKMNVKKFIYISTHSIISGQDKNAPVSEQSFPNPVSYYGLTKYAGERLVEIELKSENTKGVVVRFPSIYGKNESSGIVQAFYSLAQQDKPIEVYSMGKRYRNLIYIEDAAEVLVRLVQNDSLNHFELICVGSLDSQTMISIAKSIRDMTGSKSQIIPVDKFPPSDWDVFIDITKLQETTGFTPLSINDGIKKYLKEKGHEI